MNNTVHYKNLNIIPDGFKTSSVIDGAEYGTSGYLHQAAFLELDNKDVLIACGGNKIPGDRGGDYGGVWTYMWRSHDGGKNFHEVTTPFEKNAFHTVCSSNPTLLKLDDRIVMISRSATKDASESSTYVIFSFDNGVSWGSDASRGKDWEWKEVIYFDKDADDTNPPSGDSGFNQWGPCCFSCRPKVLKSGRLILSLCASWKEEPPSHTKHGSYFYYSDDKGVTWYYLGGIKRPPTGEVICEPAVQELPDGRLFALVRSYNTILTEEDGSLNYKASRYYYYSISNDGGKTWSEPWPAYLGSERWIGAMADVTILKDDLYILGNFLQYHEADRSGLAKDIIPEGMQRNPLLLLKVPISQVMSMKEGACILSPTAIRPVGNKLTQDLGIGGCFGSVQIDKLKDDTLGILCDTHTQHRHENKILFWKVEPSWMTEPDMALIRGPVPLVEKDGFIRIFNSQTTVMPTTFDYGRLPLDISFTLKPYQFERYNEIFVHTLFTVLTNAELNVPKAYHSQPIFTSIDVVTCHPKDGFCYFALNTGSGRMITDIPIITGHTYEVELKIHDRFTVELFVDGQKAARGYPVAPGLPAGFTLLHSWPPISVEASFGNITVTYGEGTQTAQNMQHPFSLECYNLLLRNDQWIVDLPALPWKNWMRYGGILVQSTLEKGSLCEIWVDNNLYMMLRRDKDKCILESEGKREVVNVNDSNMYILSSSTLHERTYPVSASGVGKPIQCPLIKENARENIQLRFCKELELVKLYGWDFPPASAVRTLESMK